MAAVKKWAVLWRSPWDRNTSTIADAMAAILVAFSAFGVRLAIKKGQAGPKIDWIGATFQVMQRRAVQATILESRIQELRELTKTIARSSWISEDIGHVH